MEEEKEPQLPAFPPKFEDMLPALPPAPPLPRGAVKVLDYLGYQTEYTLAEAAARVYYRQCTPEYHDYVERVRYYIKTVSPRRAAKRLHEILKPKE